MLTMLAGPPAQAAPTAPPAAAATSDAPAASEPAAGPTGAVGAERADGATADDRDPAARPSRDLAPVEGGVVTVIDTLPFVPASNTIASKLPLPLRLTPASVSVVAASLIEEQHDTVLGDALRNVSGVNPQNGNGVYDFWLVRGFDSVSSGLILTDGAPEPESSFYQLYNLERAEVLRGPAAFLYGGSPLAATVNLVRKQPLPARFARVGLTAGSFATEEATADVNVASAGGAASFRLNSLWRRSDGYRDDKASRDLAVNPAFTWRPDEATTLNVTYERAELDHRSDAGLPLVFGAGGPQVADVPRRRSYQSPFDTSEQAIDRFQVDFERRMSDRFTLRDKAYYRGFDWASRGTIFNGVFPGPTDALEVSRSLLLLDDRQEFVGNQLEAVLAVDGLGAVHHLLAGVELARQADRFGFDVALLPGIDLFAPVETAPASLADLFILPGQSLGADARTVITAPYVIDQVTVSDRLELLLGARYDDLDFKDSLSGTSRHDRQLSPLAGVVFLPRPSLSLYANAGRSFAPASTFAPEQDRVPEQSSQIEVGAKQTLAGGRVEASAALYRLVRRNIAIPDANGITRQTGDQLGRGLEVEVTALAAAHTRVLFAYAYNDSELTEFTELVFNPFLGAYAVADRSGNRPAFAPAHLANLWVSQALPRGFSVAGGAHWTSSQFIDEDNAFAIDATVTLDAAVTWRRGPWRLALNLANLTDEEVLTRGFGGTSVIPAPGFAATTGVEVTF